MKSKDVHLLKLFPQGSLHALRTTQRYITDEG